MAAPARDNFAGRMVVSGTGQVSTDISECGREAGEPYPNMGRTIWFEWTCPTNGAPALFGFDTLQTDQAADTVIAVYTGQWGALSMVVDSDDAGASSSLSLASWEPVPGVTYYIQVGTWRGADPGVPLVVRWRPYKRTYGPWLGEGNVQTGQQFRITHGTFDALPQFPGPGDIDPHTGFWTSWESHLAHLQPQPFPETALRSQTWADAATSRTLQTWSAPANDPSRVKVYDTYPYQTIGVIGYSPISVPGVPWGTWPDDAVDRETDPEYGGWFGSATVTLHVQAYATTPPPPCTIHLLRISPGDVVRRADGQWVMRVPPTPEVLSNYGEVAQLEGPTRAGELVSADVAVTAFATSPFTDGFLVVTNWQLEGNAPENPNYPSVEIFGEVSITGVRGTVRGHRGRYVFLEPADGPPAIPPPLRVRQRGDGLGTSVRRVKSPGSRQASPRVRGYL